MFTCSGLLSAQSTEGEKTYSHSTKNGSKNEQTIVIFPPVERICV